MEIDPVQEVPDDSVLDVELKELSRISWPASERQPFSKGRETETFTCHEYNYYFLV